MPTPNLPEIEPEAYYEVELKTAVMFGGHLHTPEARTIIKGSALPAFKDAIVSVNKLAAGEESQL